MADTPEPAEQNRNPIVWLISDLGKLLGGATDALISKPEPASPRTEAEKQTPEVPARTADTKPVAIENTPTILTLFYDIAKLFDPAQTSVSTDTDTAMTAAAEPVRQEPAVGTPAAKSLQDQPAVTDTKTFRNPITWLLSDLGRIFQPTLEIENQQAVADPDDKPTTPAAEVPSTLSDTPAAGTTEPQQAQADMPVNLSATPLENAAPLAASGTETSFRNPISWLFGDLARLVGASAPVESADVSTAPAAQPQSPPLAAETETHLAAVPTQTPAQVTPSEHPEVSASTKPLEIVEITPWMPTPKGDLYDPNDSLFNITGKPLHVAEVSAAPAPSLITALPEQPTVRSRIADQPEIRNYRALGHGHKSVSPDPEDQGILGNVLENIFGTDVKPEDEPLANKVAETIVPEEKLDLGYISPDAKSPAQELTRIGDGPLTNIDLYLGDKNTIGAPYDAASFRGVPCIERTMHGSVFCLKKLDWPSEISSSFSTDTAFVLPGEGVVRYENGKASRIYAVFNASDFAQVIKYMQHQFGPPQEREIVWMHMLEAPKLPNTTFRWQAFNADRTEVIVLEVRNYDDLRRSFADMGHGMVRLYRNGSRPIFKHISTMDLMLMQRRRVAQAPVEATPPPKSQ
ncbi:MAG: hypothetical protein WD075_13080 [Rhodospirillales bacterium]